MKRLLNLPPALLAAALLGVIATAGTAEATLYDIKMRLTGSVTLTSVDFVVDYSAAGGDFDGTQGDVDCTINAATNAIGAYRDDDAGEELHVGMMNISGISAPVKLITCTFDASSAPAKSDFSISLSDWTPDVGSTPNITVSGVVAQ